ncbi:MAG: hypothetical protein A4E65_01353 [Syntrophorhabdus sp. PtaU1.Bin153]|nr:MAG: hypothetical protein A4E65_01353 [Syntrophorhabdus sp. PtaU1.Bin153]
MRVYVNGQEVHIITGMTVRHALIAVGLIRDVESGKRVYDEKDNEIGLGGALAEGSRIYVK